MPKRKVTRGTSAIFEELFVEPDGTPLTPSDPARFPQVSIVDPTGTVQQDGVATRLSDGRYRYSWFVPVDADLNSADQTWQAVWNFEATNGRIVEKQGAFDVIDVADLSPAERSYTYLTLQNTSERVMIRFNLPQEEITCTVTAPNGAQMVVAQTDIQRVDDRGSIVYYLDTPELTQIGDYMVLWRARQTRLSAMTNNVQPLRVPEPCFFYLAPSLRMLIDKAKKQVGLVQAYSDPDMYEYLRQGVNTINTYNPISSWGFGNTPALIDNLVVLAAAEWAMMAQFLGETDINKFNFGGQTTTLEVDRTPSYEAMMTRIRAVLDAQVSKAKIGIVRSGSMSWNANRPYDYSLSSMVVPVSRMRTGRLNILPLMSTLGLI